MCILDSECIFDIKRNNQAQSIFIDENNVTLINWAGKTGNLIFE